MNGRRVGDERLVGGAAAIAERSSWEGGGCLVDWCWPESMQVDSEQRTDGDREQCSLTSSEPTVRDRKGSLRRFPDRLFRYPSLVTFFANLLINKTLDARCKAAIKYEIFLCQVLWGRFYKVSFASVTRLLQE